MKKNNHLTRQVITCLATGLMALSAAFAEDPKVDIGEAMPSQEGSELISVSLDDTPLNDAVRLFARLANINIISSSEIEGNVTVNLNNVAWEPALQAILDSKGYVLQEKSPGLYYVVNREDLGSEPMETDSIFLKYITTEMVLPVVQNMLVSTNASASAFPASNAIVVKETPTQLKNIKKTVEQIDKPRPQVFIETKFVELNDKAIEDLGINWKVLEGYDVGLNVQNEYSRQRGEVRQDVEANLGERFRGRTSESTRDTNRDRGSVTGEGADGSFDGSSSVNSSANNSTRNTRDSAANLTFSGKNFTQIDEEGTVEIVPVLTKTELLSAVLTATEFSATLSALKQNDGVHIVSNPKIVVTSGNTATNNVVEKTPKFRASQAGEVGSTFIVEQDGYIDAGIQLKVTPTVNTDSNITLSIQAVLSRIIDQISPSGAVAFPAPVLSERRIETEFSLMSDRTIAIGGLIQTTEEEAITKIPLLGDIPIIGKYLFSHKHTREVQDEIIVFVTVMLAKPDTIDRNSGLPTDSRLIHRHMAKKDIEQAEFEGEKREMEAASEEEVNRILLELGIENGASESDEAQPASDASAKEAAVRLVPTPPAPPKTKAPAPKAKTPAPKAKAKDKAAEAKKPQPAAKKEDPKNSKEEIDSIIDDLNAK